MTEFIITMLAFMAGGILKGAIGAGAPVLVVPVMSIYFGVPYAVAAFTLPAIASNIWQGWHYRHSLEDAGFLWRLTLGAGIGAFLGTVLLANLPGELLSLVVGVLALCYVGFKLFKPGWSLPYETARRLAAPAGFTAGVLQGAAGISAPVSVTFMHAANLGRLRFIGSISIFFLGMSCVQLPSQIGLGVMDRQIFLFSLMGCVPLFLGMPIGAWLVKRFGVKLFDRLIMTLLVVISVTLIAEAF